MEPESAVLTDSFPSYRGLSTRGFAHAALRLRDDEKLADRYFPWVHITFSNLKRFLFRDAS